MELVLKRRWLTEKSTIGELFINPTNEGARGFECYVLEDKYRLPEEPKVYGETAIPNGRYEVIITHSPKFDIDMPLLLGVQGFQGIRIHWGNLPGDTEGCLIVGQERGQDAVEFSRPAYAQLCQKLRAALGRGEKIYITVQLAVESPPVSNP